MKLLILSPDAYSIFHPETSFIFGGIEVETGHHARGLAALGVDVSVATRNQGQPPHKAGSVMLYPLPGLNGEGYWQKRKSLSGRLRFRLFGDKNRYSNLEQLFAEVNADIGYVMGISKEALQLSRFCKKNNKGFVFRVAHDKELQEEGKSADELHWTGLTKGEAREIITSADTILAQTPLQAAILKTSYGRDSTLMFPPVNLSNRGAKTIKKFDVMWVGRSNSFKRPEKLVELAKRLPEKKFCMVFNKVEERDWSALVKQLPPNVHLLESVPANEIESVFSQCRIFLSTSLQEGFPNTFLQAAKNGLPVVAMGSDPNEMLTKHGAGIFTGDDMDAVENAVTRLLSDEDQYQKYAGAAFAYVEKFNDSNVISRQFLALLENISSKKLQKGV